VYSGQCATSAQRQPATESLLTYNCDWHKRVYDGARFETRQHFVARLMLLLGSDSTRIIALHLLPNLHWCKIMQKLPALPAGGISDLNHLNYRLSLSLTT